MGSQFLSQGTSCEGQTLNIKHFKTLLRRRSYKATLCVCVLEQQLTTVFITDSLFFQFIVLSIKSKKNSEIMPITVETTADVLFLFDVCLFDHHI